MIPQAAIDEWRGQAPWSVDAFVEQDLVISRALVEIYSRPELANSLAFRGGTALNKLYLQPAARYSEDIDLVQLRAEPIGETLQLIRNALNPWLGEPRFRKGHNMTSLVYRFDSEGIPPVALRLKIEINTREHFSELGLERVPFEVNSQWFRGSANAVTYSLNELLGTKFRALYQRSKGRDLFDLWYALNGYATDEANIVACFGRYMAEGGHCVTRQEFEEYLREKAGRADFRGDMDSLLRPDLAWNFDDAVDVVLNALVARLPG